MSERSPGPRAIRWWPLPVILLLAVAGIVWARLSNEADRQSANILSISIGVLAFAMVFLWLLAFSRLSLQVRAGASLLLVAAVGFLAVSVRVRGVTGDLLPILEWRFARSDHRVEAPSAPRGPAPQPLEGLADFPQFFGPDRTGRLAGPRLARDWESRPPEELWRRAVGEGWSGFAVAGARAITQEQHGEEEAVVCYDVRSGEILWLHRDAARYDTKLAGMGPRATPTADGDRVYCQGATGILNCLELATGEVVWSRNVLEDNDAVLPEWGVAGSPLVAGDRVVVSAGGPRGRSLVAYDAASGAFVWGGGDGAAHWSSPMLATLAGREQILIFNEAVTGHDVESGEVLWRYPWPTNHPHVCLPAVAGDDRVLISSGYGTGCHLVRIEERADGLAPTTVWESRRLKAKFTNVVVRDGYVYGLDDGILTCLDLDTGERQWKSGRYGHGQVLLVGDLLLVTSEGGDVVLVEPVPEERRELARYQVFDRKTWNPPALAGRYLLVRNDREAVCLRLALAGE